MINVTTRQAAAGILAIVTLTAWAGDVPQPVALGLQLSCLLLAGANALGTTFKPLWWACTGGTALALVLGVVIQFLA